MRIYLKCQYCHHAVGMRLDFRGRHRYLRDENQVWRSLGYDSPFDHLVMPYNWNVSRGEYPEIYHLSCEEAYSWWKRIALEHKMNCHLENCPHSNPYPFRRFNLPFSVSPTTLGDPIKPPEEVVRLLRL